ncbi:MAG: 3-hydroxyacyl-ACP dehydratase FabZ family protein, partial [Planctomycetota bacterium]
SRQEIYQVNPHRYEFQQIDGIYFIDHDEKAMAGYRDLREDEFWVRGHIPGRPIFPGVLMIETAAQLVSYYVMSTMPDKGFMGFAAVDGVKFRGQVAPGQRVIMVGKMVEIKSRRCVGATQAFVDGKQVYEGIITGMWI